MIAPSRTPGKPCSDAELQVRDALGRLDLEYGCRDVAIRIIKPARKKGRTGWRVLDFRVGTVLIEVSVDDDPERISAVNFIRDRYGLQVVRLTANLVEAVAANPAVLAQLIEQAELFQATSDAQRHSDDILAAAEHTTQWRAHCHGKAKRLAERRRRRARRTTEALASTAVPGLTPLFQFSNELTGATA